MVAEVDEGRVVFQGETDCGDVKMTDTILFMEDQTFLVVKTVQFRGSRDPECTAVTITPAELGLMVGVLQRAGNGHAIAKMNMMKGD